MDLDAYISEREGKSISEIFGEVGEEGFRKIELECLQDVLEENISEHPETIEDMTRCTMVLSLGGGIITTPECRDLISRFTYCIYVKTDIETIFRRLSENAGDRPMLKDSEGEKLKESIERLYREREPYYISLAKKTI